MGLWAYRARLVALLRLDRRAVYRGIDSGLGDLESHSARAIFTVRAASTLVLSLFLFIHFPDTRHAPSGQ